MEEIIVYFSYNKFIKESNDIVLLKFKKFVKFGKGVGFVCMLDFGFFLLVDDVNRKCWIIGWGCLFDGG